MYIVTPYPNMLHALDLSQHGALKWTYRPAPLSESQGLACCDVVNRGVAVWEGKVFAGTIDGSTIRIGWRAEDCRALDAF